MTETHFFSLIDKNTNKEVYSSPAYYLPHSDTIDYRKVINVFKFYLDRINSGIKQQLESPKIPEDQKKNLKYHTPDEYLMAFCLLTNSGGYSTHTYWKKELKDYSEMKDYQYGME